MNSAVRTTKPIVQALLIADHVYQDRATGKCIIAGIFNRIFTLTKPEPEQLELEQPEQAVIPVDGEGQVVPVQEVLQAGSPYAYVSLTDMRDKTELQLRYVFLREEKVFFEYSFIVESLDPLETKENVIPLPTLPTYPLGTYALELLCDQEILGSVRITTEERKIKNDDND